jgi:transposase
MRIEMPEIRKKYVREFREGAVRIVEETGKPIAQIARDLGVNVGTLGNWVTRARAGRDGSLSLSTGDYEELKRLRAEVAELRDCPANGVSDLTRRRVLAGRLVTDDRDNHGREFDAQGWQEAAVVVDGDTVGEGGDRAVGQGGAGAG